MILGHSLTVAGFESSRITVDYNTYQLSDKFFHKPGN